MERKYFMHRIKLAKGTYDKGIEIHDTLESAKQSYHAYLGAYSYGHDKDTDYVQCSITEMNGGTIMVESWTRPEQEPEE